MGKSDTGKIIAVLGGLIAIIAVLIGLLSPEIGWYNLTYEIITITFEYNLNAFGYVTFGNGDPEFAEDTLILLGGLIVLIGGILIILGGAKGNKAISIISGILMIIGLVVFCFALNANETWEAADYILGLLGEKPNVFFGSYGNATWGLGIGFFIGVAGAIIGTVGAFIMD